MPDAENKTDIDELRRMLRRIEGESKVRAPRPARAVAIEDTVAGRVVETDKGAFYLVEEDADRFLLPDDEFSSVAELFFKRGQANLAHLRRLGPALGEMAGLPPERILFLDIETAGFHGMALFLVGLLVYREGRFVVSGLFARDYAEEAAVLEYLRAAYGASDAVVTFNGRAFDLPFIADRALVHRVELTRPRLDVDLLHVARRIWKKTLPDCRLVTLEQLICGRRRTGDLPSHLIPQAYHDYVATGNARLMADVIRHNAYDLITMAHLLAKIANG
ncbi:MAG: ribonuclease H-like domain-containing protein [Planctomycetes bacterium]|nr:ribonuclease H-like domain-containing protein [Planctomycetota bacterium]